MYVRRNILTQKFLSIIRLLGNLERKLKNIFRSHFGLYSVAIRERSPKRAVGVMLVHEIDKARGWVGKLLWSKRTRTFIAPDRYLFPHN